MSSVLFRMCPIFARSVFLSACIANICAFDLSKFFMNRLPENHDSEGAGFLETFAWLCAAVAFAPIAVGLYGALIQSRQLGEAVVILAVSLAVLAIEYGIKPHRPRFSGESARWLLFAYIALFSAKYFGIWGVFLCWLCSGLCVSSALIACDSSL